MGNWWFDEQKVNNLKGSYDDPENRPVLPDEAIVEFLLNIQAARQDFFKLLPNMLPEEQERLNGILAKNPRILAPEPNLDPGIQADRLMRSFNTQIPFHDPNRRR